MKRLLAPALVALTFLAGCGIPDTATGYGTTLTSEAAGEPIVEQETSTTGAAPDVSVDDDQFDDPALQNAVRQAESYLSFSAFSREGLIGQLVFEQYDADDAEVAVDSLNVDWNEQAAKQAESYLSHSPFSCQGLIDQLLFEGYTSEQATYGAEDSGIC